MEIHTEREEIQEEGSSALTLPMANDILDEGFQLMLDDIAEGELGLLAQIAP